MAHAATTAETRPPEVSLTRLKLVMLVLVLVLLGRGVTDTLARYRFGINETESLPNWAFITDVRDRKPVRGDLVTFVAPPNPYYPAGAEFVKRVAGVPGDRVEVRGREFLINGAPVGRAKERSRDGRPAELGPTGIIPRDHYFVVTPHVDSLDSRYAVIGWVSRSSIVGVAEPVL
jgi:conjugal transfer pilin signal peptidase TrbI